MTTFKYENMEFVIPTVFKATKRQWAQELIDQGTIYFTSIAHFLCGSDPQRTDPNEGKQHIVRNGVLCRAEYDMPIYIWCCSMECNPDRLLAMWGDKDCVIQIRDTIEFAKRIHATIEKTPWMWPLRLGPVAYTKTKGGHENTDWADGIFQKDDQFDGQKEFRFALAGFTGTKDEGHRILHIGACKDIVRIVS